jgi:queuine tRNA-ribosyltransferase
VETAGYRLVRLKNGSVSVRSEAEGETFHPVIGPVAEAEALYVRQLRLPERVASHRRFVLWDVGLGAGANVFTALRHLSQIPARLEIVSFDRTLDPLRFALEQADKLGFVGEFAPATRQLLDHHTVEFRQDALEISWRVHVSDFPTLVSSGESVPAPHAIFYDAFSPARNAAMWTLPLFTALWQRLDPARPCALATYSRATLVRTTLLCAGFRVGAGHATGEKEETTIAANTAELIEEPLNGPWLERARRSTSAEPLGEPNYRQSRLSQPTLNVLERHPQFSGGHRSAKA